MLNKIKELKDELKAQYEDIMLYPRLYWIMWGLIAYQMIIYLIIGFMPYVLIKMLIWWLFMVIFIIVLFLIETPITYTEFYHLTIISIVQLLLPLEINLNPAIQFLILNLIFRRLRHHLYLNLSTSSLLPYVIKDHHSSLSTLSPPSAISSFLIQLSLTFLLLPISQHLSPSLLYFPFSAFSLSPSVFPVLYCSLLLQLFCFSPSLLQPACCVLYSVLLEPANALCYGEQIEINYNLSFIVYFSGSILISICSDCFFLK